MSLPQVFENIVKYFASGHQQAADPHTRVHAGELFTFDTLIMAVDQQTGAETITPPTINNGASLALSFIADADNYPHVTWSYSLEGAGYFTIYKLLKNTNPLTDGTAVNIRNLKGDSVKEFLGEMKVNPTFTLVGATYMGGGMISGSGVGSNRVGSYASREHEFILEQDQPYILLIRNASGGAVRGFVEGTIYNSVHIPT